MERPPDRYIVKYHERSWLVWDRHDDSIVGQYTFVVSAQALADELNKEDRERLGWDKPE